MEQGMIAVFSLGFWDYFAFVAFLAGLSIIGYVSGRKERDNSDDYFLAGRRLPWYVIGGSYIAANISSEHFIGMVASAFVFGICIAVYEWGNVLTFSLIIWFFIPFLLASRVFTMPEFLERRFNSAVRQMFAVVTVLSSVTAFLAAVLYGGAMGLQQLFPSQFGNLWFAIALLGVVAGAWAIYGGLSSVAWTDLFGLLVMVFGGILVTILGLQMLSGDSNSVVEGFKVMLERNRATVGIWKEVVQLHAQDMAKTDTYNRLSVFQSPSHVTAPWTGLIFGVFTVSIWYNVLNQFMIQRVLGAKNAYHARMGIVFAGFLKLIMPAIVVLPGLILFAKYPEVLNRPWNDLLPEADKGYVRMLQTLLPIGVRGLFLAALFSAIQSHINATLNSTATVVTLDFYKRIFRPQATDQQLVRMGMWTSVIILVISIVLAGFVGKIGGSLFIYIQTLYNIFAPPFSAIFLLGILWRRINAVGATTAVVLGFAMGIFVKLYLAFGGPHPAWLETYINQAIITWTFSMVVCIVVSLATAPPTPDKVTDQLTFNWRKLNIFEGLGNHWYSSVITWWALFFLIIAAVMITFSGYIFHT